MVKYTFENIFKNLKKRVENAGGCCIFERRQDVEDIAIYSPSGKKVGEYISIGSIALCDFGELRYFRRWGLNVSRNLRR